MMRIVVLLGALLFPIGAFAQAGCPAAFNAVGLSPGACVTSAPTITSGTCGTGTNGSVAGSDQGGLITIGSATTTSCPVVFSATWPVAPKSCTFSPATSASAAVTVLAYISALGTGGFTLSGSVLASTSFYYQCR